MNRLFHPHLLSLYRPLVPVRSVSESLFARNGRKTDAVKHYRSALLDISSLSSNIRVTEIVQNRVGLFLSRNSLYGFRTFCTGEDLTTKKCVPCDTKDLRPMAEESAKHLMPKVVGWDLVNENGIFKLKRSLKVKSFTKGLELFKLVADVAEAEGHHPDLHLVGWNNVQIEIWTHAVGGLTENDFILAAKINRLGMHHLLRRKIST